MKKTENLPKELQENGLFCCWRYEERDGRKTKVPYNPRTGGRAQSNNPRSFSTRQIAAAVQSQYDGLGVGVFGDFCAIDIDHCFDPDSNQYSPLACELMAIMGLSYMEFSPSKTGLHIYFKAPGFQYDKTRYFINNQKLGLEIYIAGCTNKYLTLTGNALTSGLEYADRSKELQTILDRYMVRPERERPEEKPTGAAPVALDDFGLLSKIRSSKSGSTFEALWSGDTSAYDGDDSRADLALCNILAFWTGRDADRMDDLFRRSGLMREKWDRRQSGSTYGALAIQNAISSCREVYDPETYKQRAAEEHCQKAGKHSDIKPTLVAACDIPYEPPRWLIAPYFQRGKGTLIQGDNGSGKTAFMCAIAATVSTGRDLLGLKVETPGNVLILSVEDDLPVLRGRIEASGGDLSKCHFMDNAAGISFNDSIVEQAVKSVGAKLLVFDPFQAFLGAGVDMFRANETRPQLAKLFEMCDRNDCACSIIAHTAKAAGDKSPVNRALGSVDIPASMRSVMQLTRNPDDDSECVMIHVKCSNAPKGQSISYSIGDRGGVHWNGFSPMTAEDLTIVTKRKKRGISYDHEPLVQVFNQLIADKPGGGFWSYTDLRNESAKILGFPPYSDITDLRRRLDGGLARELQQRDGLIVTHSAKSRGNVRGVRIEQYQIPTGYQMGLGGN